MTKNEVIETIRTWIQTIDDEYDIEEQGRVYGLMEALELIKQIEPEQKWIPVSERLPEEGESVLTQAMFKDDMKMCVSSRIDWNYWTGWGTRNINIIAWMPLPEPYEPQESEEV